MGYTITSRQKNWLVFKIFALWNANFYRHKKIPVALNQQQVLLLINCFFLAIDRSFLIAQKDALWNDNFYGHPSIFSFWALGGFFLPKNSWHLLIFCIYKPSVNYDYSYYYL